MIKNALQGIADAITSEDFARLFIVSAIMFFLGMIVGVSVCDYSVKKQCDEMSITEALKYPYCRNYFEKELEKWRIKMEEKEIKDFPIDPEQIQETLDKLCKIARSIAKVISDTFSEFWDRIGGNVILQYKKLYEKSQWKYIKKGKRYVKVRRNSSEDIGRAFSRKIKHYKKKVQRSLSSK